MVPNLEAHSAVECDIVASATAAVGAADIPRLREPILAAFSDRLGNALLKQADEQSLLALTAIHEILMHEPAYSTNATRWGLVAAPRMPGRRRMTEALAKFKDGGAWAVSPHIIPHCTLHSLSGLLSQALGLVGPNIGTGGMRGIEGDALTVAAAWLACERLQGVWVVLTGWDREAVTGSGATCQSVVLGLTQRQSIKMALPRLCISPAGPTSSGLPLFTVETLRAALESSTAGSWQLPGAGNVNYHPQATILESAA